MTATPMSDEPCQLVEAVPAFLRSRGLDPVTTKLIVPGLEYQLWIDDRPKRIPVGRNSGDPVFGGELVTQKQLANRLGLVGVTGWNWQSRQTQFIILDFDAKDHAAGHIEEVLDRVVEAAQQLGWAWVRRSKGGRGIHLVIVLSKPMTAQTGREHEQNADAIVDRMTEDARFDFRKYLDCSGVVGYVWAPEVATNAFDVLVQPVRDTPEIHPRETDHGQPRCRSADPPSELSEQHRADIQAMRTQGFVADFADGRLLCHSKGFETLYTHRGRPGSYRSRSEARNRSKANAFAFPCEDGGWIVSRFGVKPEVEYDCWYPNAAGFATARVRPPAESLVSTYQSHCDESTGEDHHVAI